jgi:hypothetical protein
MNTSWARAGRPNGSVPVMENGQKKRRLPGTVHFHFLAREPQVRFELTTARLRIGCSTPELLWQVLRMPWSGLEPLCLTAPPPQDGVSTNFTTRATSLHSRQDHREPHPSTDSRHRHRKSFLTRTNSQQTTGPTGLEPATSRVTVECSNQAELRPQLLESGSETPSSPRTFLANEPIVSRHAE